MAPDAAGQKAANPATILRYPAANRQRGDAMRAVLVLAAGLIGLPLAVFAQPAQQPDIPVVHYKAVPEWPKPMLGDKGLPAGPWNYWQVTSVAVEKNGNILVMHRGDDPILEYKPDGSLIGPWGEVKFDEGKVAAVAKKDRDPNKSGYQATYGAGG